MRFALPVLFIALVAPLAAPCQSLYVGADFATSRLHSAYSEQATGASSSNYYVGPAEARTSRESGGRLLVGARLMPWLAIEVDYTSAGTLQTFHRSRSVHGVAFGFGERTIDGKLDSVGASAVARAPIAAGFFVEGRAGISRTRLRLHERACSFSTFGPQPPVLVGCTEPDRPDLTQARPNAGIAFGYRLSDRWELAAGWDRYFGIGKTFVTDSFGAHDQIGKFDFDRFAIGAKYRF